MAARSARRRAIVVITSRLSYSPPRLPRVSEVRMIRSRRPRLSRDARAGWPLVFSSGMTYRFSRPRAAAAAAAAAIRFSERPASSSRVSTTTAEAFTSSSTFCVKRLDSAASSALISCIRSFSASDSRAPARTKSTWYSSTRRRDSSSSASDSRWS